VIGIEPDIFEVVVFTAGANAFLSVRNPSRHVGALPLAKKNRDELVQPALVKADSKSGIKLTRG
jgi:hypothetical protein